MNESNIFKSKWGIIYTHDSKQVLAKISYFEVQKNQLLISADFDQESSILTKIKHVGHKPHLILAHSEIIYSNSYMPGSFHLSFFIIFGDEVTKISCHFQAKTVQLIFSFFVIYEKPKWDETLINMQKWFFLISKFLIET